MIADRAESVAAIVAEVEQRMPQLVQEYRERLARKLRDTIEAAFPGGFQHIRGEELSERLAHEATLFGLRIDVALVDTVPLGVDTPADLERARKLLAPK